MVRPRDNQRSKLYKAELEALKDHPSNIKYDKLLSQSQELVDKLVVHDKWFNRYWSEVKVVTVLPGKGHKNATAYRYRHGYKNDYCGFIQLPKWARTSRVILHELAHIITPNSCAAHGWEFAKNYLQLVRHVMGKEAENELKKAFKRNRVKYNPPRKISKKRKEQLREHMLQVRLAACKNNNTD